MLFLEMKILPRRLLALVMPLYARSVLRIMVWSRKACGRTLVGFLFFLFFSRPSHPHNLQNTFVLNVVTSIDPLDRKSKFYSLYLVLPMFLHRPKIFYPEQVLNLKYDRLLHRLRRNLQRRICLL